MRRSTTPTETLTALAAIGERDGTLSYAGELARNPNSSAEVLEACWAETERAEADNLVYKGIIRNALAANPSCPEHLIVQGRLSDPVTWLRAPSTSEQEWEDALETATRRAQVPLPEDPLKWRDLPPTFGPLIAAPSCPSSVLDRIDRIDEEWRPQIAGHANCPQRILDTMFRSSDLDDRVKALQSPAARNEMLVVAATNSKKEIRAAAAANPNLTDAASLAKLARDKAKDVRFALPRNPGCPPEGLTAAIEYFDNIANNMHGKTGRGSYGSSRDRQENSRRLDLLAAVSDHPNLTEGHIQTVLDRSASGEWDEQAAKHLMSKRTQGFPDEITRQVVHGDQHPAWVRAAYASNPFTPQHHLRVLAADPDPDVIWQLTENEMAASPAVADLLGRNPASGHGWRTRHTRAMVKAQGQIWQPGASENCPRCGQFMSAETGHACPERESSPAVALHRNDRVAVARSAATSPDELTDLAAALALDRHLMKVDPRTVDAVLTNPAAPDEAIAALVETGDLAHHQTADAAAHPNTSADTLELLRRTADVGTKVNVAVHPNASPDTLRLLQETGDVAIREAISLRGDASTLVGYDNRAQFRWRHFHNVSTEPDRPFTAEVSATDLRKALDRIGAPVDGRNKDARLVAVEASADGMRISRTDWAAAATITVPGTSDQSGAAVVPLSGLRYLLKGAGRGTVTLSFDGDSLSSTGRDTVLADHSAAIPVVTRQTAPGDLARYFTMNTEEFERFEHAREHLGEDNPSRRNMLSVQSDGRRRYTTMLIQAGERVGASYSTAEPVDPPGDPTALYVPQRVIEAASGFEGPVRVESRMRDTLITSDDMSVVVHNAGSGTNPDSVPARPPGRQIAEQFDLSSAVASTYDTVTLRAAVADIKEINEVASAFTGDRPRLISAVSVRLSEVGPNGYVVSVPEWEHTNPITVGTPDPAGPTVEHNHDVLFDNLDTVAPSGRLFAKSGMIGLDVGDGLTRLVLKD